MNRVYFGLCVSTRECHWALKSLRYFNVFIKRKSTRFKNFFIDIIQYLKNQTISSVHKYLPKKKKKKTFLFFLRPAMISYHTVSIDEIWMFSKIL